MLFNMLLNVIMNVLFPSLQKAYETNPIFRPWDDPLMMMFFLYPILLGLAFAFIWDKTKQLFQGSIWKKGFNFGLVYFFLASVPMFVINLSSFKLPLSMILSWTIMSIFNGIIGGIVLAKINK